MAEVASLPRSPAVRVEVTDGDHLLPLLRPGVVATWIATADDLAGDRSR